MYQFNSDEMSLLVRFKKCKEVGMTYNNMDDTSVQIPRDRFEAKQRELAQITCSKPSASSTFSKDRSKMSPYI